MVEAVFLCSFLFTEYLNSPLLNFQHRILGEHPAAWLYVKKRMCIYNLFVTLLCCFAFNIMQQPMIISLFDVCM